MDVDEELFALLSQQRLELREAKLADSDLDFAFQLQLQEAINASVSQIPSSSASASSSDFQFENDDVSSLGLAQLLDEEIEKFELERSDLEQAQSEARRMQDDLNRRIHDQAFARQILQVPEQEWRNTGEYFQKPYGEGSSKAAENVESFRLYVKGLMNGVMNESAGIGVAVCDSTDTPIFEISKLLIGVTSREFAGLRALIEGLNAAVAFGIKRITIFCEDNSLYQYITGKWIPVPRSKIGTMVDEVTELQRKFTHCTPSLLTRENINHASKLAQQAMQVDHNQVNKATESCSICLEDTCVDHMFSIDTCMHRYCFTCMNKHVEAKLHQGILPKCPHEGCKSDIKIQSSKKFLTPKVYDMLSQMMKEASIPANERIYCPFPKCSALMSRDEVQWNAERTIGGGEVVPRQCTKCRQYFCVYCKVPWHKNLSCNYYKKENPYPSEADFKLENLAVQKKWRQCVKCNNMVELAHGCYHIYCRYV
jgi:ribonuclease HI